MAQFPIPERFTSLAADIARDEHKRVTSPPSFFFAQANAIELASDYFTGDRIGGYSGVATKHLNRIRGALLTQLLAAYEFCVKDFIAQVLDATDLYDSVVEKAKWIDVSASNVLALRDAGGAGVGALLIHPLMGWHETATVNDRYQAFFNHDLIPDVVLGQQLQRLWIVRHSFAHNAGFVTGHDAYRLGAPHLREQAAAVDHEYIGSAANLLRSIARRLSTDIGDAVRSRWFATRATGSWADDQTTYVRLCEITACVERRSGELSPASEADYLAALQATPAGTP